MEGIQPVGISRGVSKPEGIREHQRLNSQINVNWFQVNSESGLSRGGSHEDAGSRSADI